MEKGSHRMLNHIKEIAAKLPEYGLDAMLVNSEPGEFYAIGMRGEGVAIVTPDKTWYYTDSRYIEVAQAEVRNCEVALPKEGENYRQLTQAIVEARGIKKLGFEEEYLSVAEFNLWKEAVSAQFVPASKLLAELRAVKDPEEVKCLKEAQRITDEAFTAICKFIQPGMTEKEIAARLVYEMMSRGAEKVSFDPIVASGPNGSKPHAVPSDKKVEKGEFITMDFGCKFGGYCSDMTRTVALGEPSEEMKTVYATVLKAQLAGIAAAKGGAVGAEVHKVAADIIGEAGYGAYFGHGLGHAVGIEIHENPRFSPMWPAPVPAGAALSVEPGIYLPGKFGVRIEDVVILTQGGCENITKSPKELMIL